MLTEITIGFFIVAAIVLYWLGRHARRDPLGRSGVIEVGMSELDVLASIGPPDEIRRHKDPLDPGFFADTRRESYVYRGRRAVHFERGQVVGVSHDESLNPSPPPQRIATPPPTAGGAPFDPDSHTRPSAAATPPVESNTDRTTA